MKIVLSKEGWSTLEITKLIISVLTPLLLFWLGFTVNQASKENERALKEIEQIRETKKNSQLAIQSLAKRIYERRSRSELLASSIRRNVSETEIILRKTQYDDAYFSWNRDHQANLLLVRSVLGEKEYSIFESLIEFHLVGKVFRPLDSCLTDAYDHRIRSGESGSQILKTCESRRLIQEVLDCGYALTDELYKLTQDPDNNSEELAVSIVSERCPD